MSLVESRAAAYHDLAKRKSSIALTWDQLVHLDEFLSARFGITQLPDGFDWWAGLESRCGKSLARKYRKLYSQQVEYYEVGTQPPHALERTFYNLIAQDPLSGLVHSQKRPIILDAASMLTRLMEVGDIRGAALDIGCNGGYHALWLATQGQLTKLLGIDDASACVAYADRVAALNKPSRTSLSFKSVAFNDVVGVGAFDLVYSIDGALSLGNFKSISAAAGLLDDGGVLVVCQRAPALWGASIGAAEALGLGLVLLDVVGGWNGSEFDAEPVFVFVKGAKAGCPSDPEAEATSIWIPGFRDYANGGVPPSEKTQAYYRTSVTYGSRALKET
jgi:2-polyprenyl-3-methyl-5-hydroxy-6-metoxy-1,4-benzoquinol methylase